MSARADSERGPRTGVASDDMPKRTQNYGATRRIFKNTPVIKQQSDNVSTVRLAESDSESDNESELAALFSTLPLVFPSSRPVLDVERFIEETARMRRAA
jgi:hypothetical protein